MPKAKGDPYFISCRTGAERPHGKKTSSLLWDGPTGLDAAKQNEVVEGWITRGVDAISVAVENGPGISGVLRKARAEASKLQPGMRMLNQMLAIISSIRRLRKTSARRWQTNLPVSWATKANLPL